MAAEWQMDKMPLKQVFHELDGNLGNWEPFAIENGVVYVKRSIWTDYTERLIQKEVTADEGAK